MREKFFNHLWYFNNITIGFAFFDSTLLHAIKREMVEALQKFSHGINGRDDLKRKLSNMKIMDLKKLKLSDFVTQDTMQFFEILGINTEFLNFDPSSWSNREDYKVARKLVKSLPVINDVSERAVALCGEFHKKITYDADEMEGVLRVASTHRTDFPTCDVSKNKIPKKCNGYR